MYLLSCTVKQPDPLIAFLIVQSANSKTLCPPLLRHLGCSSWCFSFCTLPQGILKKARVFFRRFLPRPPDVRRERERSGFSSLSHIGNGRVSTVIRLICKYSESDVVNFLIRPYFIFIISLSPRVCEHVYY